MRISLFVLAFVAAAMAFAGLAYAVDTSPCSDGTAYGHCSTVNPGNFCTGSVSSPGLAPYTNFCICENVPGWVTQGTGETATCVQAKCDDGTKMGECTTTKPKFCVGGSTYADNATKCGCPSGQQPSKAGIVCEYLPCSDGTKDTMCSAKAEGKKCVQGSLVDRASDCPCTNGYTKQGEACVLLCTDGTPAGQCSTTQPMDCSDNGYLLANANKCGCPSGQIADSSGKRCISSGLGGISGSELLGSPAGSSQNASGAASGTGIGGLSCCCLPTALIGLAGGFVFFRKKK